MRVLIKDIESASNKILEKLGVPLDDMKIITESIVYAHEHGKPTHGIGRLPIYARKIKEGLMTPVTHCQELYDGEAIVRLDCNNGFGQVATYHAMNRAIDKAKRYGIGLVSVCHSNNFGTAGFYSRLAAKENMVGIAIANSAPAISLRGGKALLGTNPVSVALPTEGVLPDFNLDMAMSNAARGKIRLALQNGEAIPLGLAVDVNGCDTTDPARALEGAMLPIGGIKGAGLAMVIDIMAGMLSGASFGGDVRNLNHPTDESNCGHMLMAVDIKRFMDINTYMRKMDYFVAKIHRAGAMFPGEHGAASGKNGFCDISEKQVESIRQLADNLKVEVL
ncbi:MAG: Ldh family oxidoreductase [Lachnospiraceae bacterium]|nr:Ldh family oxidoreductase [Lachnospiraceae bacterium]